jgi:hypothetical protein
VRLRLSSDGTQVHSEVWDADPWPPTAADKDEDRRPDPQAEKGRGPFLVVALSARWDRHPAKEPRGKGCLVRDRGITVGDAKSGRSRSWLPGRIAAGQPYEPVEQRRGVRNAYRRAEQA